MGGFCHTRGGGGGGGGGGGRVVRGGLIFVKKKVFFFKASLNKEGEVRIHQHQFSLNILFNNFALSRDQALPFPTRNCQARRAQR